LPNEVIPAMTDWGLYPEVAASVAYASSEKGYARKHESKAKFLQIATEIIEHNRKAYRTLLDNGSIAKLPED
ncbi:hypothetical protein B1B_08356, partial [mine drainage metagenome]